MMIITEIVVKKPRGPSSVRATLLAARRLLVEKGWIQGAYHTKNGYCLSGALCAVNGKYEGEARWRIRRILGLLRDDMSTTVFNDMPGRTKEEVLALLTQAARGEKQNAPPS